MSTFTDQHGRPLSTDAFITQMSEAILANAIALYEGGVPHDAVKLIVGTDGGTVMGGGAMLQTPVAQRLSETHARQLHDAVGALLAAYDAGAVPPKRLEAIRARHDVARKIRAVRAALEESREP